MSEARLEGSERMRENGGAAAERCRVEIAWSLDSL